MPFQPEFLLYLRYGFATKNDSKLQLLCFLIPGNFGKTSVSVFIKLEHPLI
mgnify:CR=1 FL=1